MVNRFMGGINRDLAGTFFLFPFRLFAFFPYFFNRRLRERPTF
jgi:hypothetical protein